MTNIQPIAVDLFCGAGGLSKGLKDSGIDVKVAVEIDSVASKTYINNLDNVVINKDIRQVASNDILSRLNMKQGELFLLAGCPPCQTFSSLQKGNIVNDERDQLVFEFVRLALELEPLFILMENVPGMSRGRGKDIFNKAKVNLEDKYYLTFDIVNCADYGVPQTRKRLVLHGIRKDIYENYFCKFERSDILHLPIKTHTNNTEKHCKLLRWKTASVIKDLPPVKAGEKYNGDSIYNHESNGLSELNIKRIQYIRKHGGSRSCLPEELQLKCHKNKNVGYSGVYGVINYKDPAPTITGGCICYSKGRFGHPTQDRAITVREAARLQSFPDDYIFYGNRGQTALQVGNAVPPLIAQASGLYFLNLLQRMNTNNSE